MNDEHVTPPPEDQEAQGDPKQLPKSEEGLQDALKAIYNDEDGIPAGEDSREQGPVVEYEQDALTSTEEGGSLSQDPRKLPRSDAELRLIVREIVSEVLDDVEAVRRAAAEPVDVVTIPQLMIPRVRLSRKQVFSAAAALVIFVGVPVAWATWPRNVDLPDGAVGLWQTITPSYSDRAFRVTKNTLTFHVSPTDSTFHPIVRVRAAEDQEEGATRYTIVYTHYGDEYEFHFFYDEEPETTIRFVNQKEMTWRKGSS